MVYFLVLVSVSHGPPLICGFHAHTYTIETTYAHHAKSLGLATLSNSWDLQLVGAFGGLFMFENIHLKVLYKRLYHKVTLVMIGKPFFIYYVHQI